MKLKTSDRVPPPAAAKRPHPFLIALLALMVISIFGAAAAVAQSGQSAAGDVRISTAWSADRVRPGDRVILAIVLEIDAGLHVNADTRQLKPIDNFKPFPTELSLVSAPAGIVSERPRYPKAHPVKFDFADEALMVFDGRIVIYLPLQIDEQFSATTLTLELQLAYQACGKDFCLFPQRVPRTVTVPVTARGTRVSATHPEIFADYRELEVPSADPSVTFDLFGLSFTVEAASGAGWLLVLLTAALGGLLLNVTPCVLPMIPIKVIGLAHAAEQRSRCAALGLSTFGGVVVFWGALGLLIAFVSGFTAANQLFQYPAFTISVGIIIAAMGLGMFGAFSVKLPQVVYRFNPRQDTLVGSFGIGILTAVLSTPCTAPFMGAAAAFAATQSPGATLSAFLVIGAGMGLPYLVLSLYPALVSRVPKTGPASELVKEIMGLFMLAAAAYFIGIGLSVILAEPPSPAVKWHWWPVMGICAAAGAWLAVKSLRRVIAGWPGFVLGAIGIAIVGLSLWGGLRLTDKGPVDWVAYTPERLQAAAVERRVAVLVFTAEWCLNCKALEKNVFANPKIVSLLSRPEVIAMKADITGQNPDGKKKLRELGHLTIPLLVVYTAEGRIGFKGDFYTADQLSQAIHSAMDRQTEKKREKS